MSIYANWGEDFLDAPQWCIALANWMCLPPEARDEDERTMKAWALKYKEQLQAPGLSAIYRVQDEPEFKRLRQAVAEGLGITEAHRFTVLDNLYRLASSTNDTAAVRLYLELAGISRPASEVKLSLADLDDDELERKMVEKGLALAPPSALPPPKES